MFSRIVPVVRAIFSPVLYVVKMKVTQSHYKWCPLFWHPISDLFGDPSPPSPWERFTSTLASGDTGNLDIGTNAHHTARKGTRLVTLCFSRALSDNRAIRAVHLHFFRVRASRASASPLLKRVQLVLPWSEAFQNELQPHYHDVSLPGSFYLFFHLCPSASWLFLSRFLCSMVCLHSSLTSWRSLCIVSARVASSLVLFRYCTFRIAPSCLRPSCATSSRQPAHTTRPPIQPPTQYT